MVEDPSLTGVIGVIVLVSCYFMPTIVALVRDKRGAGGVALVNFFLGWTVIGWFVALIWASSGITRKEKLIQEHCHSDLLQNMRPSSIRRANERPY